MPAGRSRPPSELRDLSGWRAKSNRNGACLGCRPRGMFQKYSSAVKGRRRPSDSSLWTAPLFQEVVMKVRRFAWSVAGSLALAALWLSFPQSPALHAQTHAALHDGSQAGALVKAVRESIERFHEDVRVAEAAGLWAQVRLRQRRQIRGDGPALRQLLARHRWRARPRRGERRDLRAASERKTAAGRRRLPGAGERLTAREEPPRPRSSWDSSCTCLRAR